MAVYLQVFCHTSMGISAELLGSNGYKSMIPRAARLLNGRDFRAAYSYSRTYASSRLVLYVRIRKSKIGAEDGAAQQLRIGYSISKKICKKAHDRNLLKRRLREITRIEILPRSRNAKSIDVVVVARKLSVEAAFDVLKEDLCRLFLEASVVSQCL